MLLQGGGVFRSGCQGNPSSSEVQDTKKHATMFASRQHIKLLRRDGQKSVYCACMGGVIIGAEAREPVSNGQICIWARMCKWF
jgi:hypothetical protein